MPLAGCVRDAKFAGSRCLLSLQRVDIRREFEAPQDACTRPPARRPVREMPERADAGLRPVAGDSAGHVVDSLRAASAGRAYALPAVSSTALKAASRATVAGAPPPPHHHQCPQHTPPCSHIYHHTPLHRSPHRPMPKCPPLDPLSPLAQERCLSCRACPTISCAC